jgi:hypothetical protein
MKEKPFPKAWVNRMGLLVGFLLIAPVLNSASESTGSPDNDVHPPTPILVWHGPSEIGYLRVELWNKPASERPFTQELVVKSASYEGSVTYNGLMLRVPTEIKMDPVITQIFVRSPSDIEAHKFREFSILATLAPDGTLRLYGYGNNLFIPACVLRPCD